MMDQPDKPRAKPKVQKVNQNQVPKENVPAPGQAFNSLDHGTLCNKLIETVDMIKELHQGNKLLRDNVQTVSEQMNSHSNENFQLQNENRDLRDRMEILENVIGA